MSRFEDIERRLGDIRDCMESMQRKPEDKDENSWQSLCIVDIDEIQKSLEKLKSDLEWYRSFLRGDSKIVLDYSEAADLFRCTRHQDSETYEVKLADLYRLASNKRGRDEQDEEDAR